MFHIKKVKTNKQTNKKYIVNIPARKIMLYQINININDNIMLGNGSHLPPCPIAMTPDRSAFTVSVSGHLV